ncbi:hypothetical protein BK026_17775 [Alteromonas sp. V450]|uniref:ECF-type sigma factor n=1 Tax=Alteromonas sp. V450 TaxID=1912139 RepID=UPI0008FF5E10|nr:ECF-type sigma factor [Alteromonas sp. V450]OJF70470.1 hypothetical protein BK026_17775 [Alteromonas sp. V450]
MSQAITQAIIDWQTNKKDAQEHFYLVIYDHLRQLASKNRQRVVERFGNDAIQEHVNSTTSLVHELYIKLSQNQEFYNNRAEFFFMVSRTIHNILVDQARKNSAEKRSADIVSFEDVTTDAPIKEIDSEFIALSESIERLTQTYPRQARVIQLKYFGGLLAKEIADVLAVSLSSVEKDISFARAWLKVRLS